jgi:hypothetical protein
MAVFDTGPIDNRNAPRTTQLTIRLFNTGRMPAIAGVEEACYGRGTFPNRGASVCLCRKS